MKGTTMHATFLRLRGAAAAAVLSAGVLAACDTDVVNPGRVQEMFLYETDAQAAIVNGIGRGLAEAQNWVGYTGAAVTREIHPSGSTGSFGIQVEWQDGELDYETINTHWNLSQRARWWGTDGIAKINETGAHDQALLAEAYLWAGYANRLMGENFCMSVIDGGSAGPRSAYLDAAMSHFDQAASLGSGDVAMAARAARASVKAFTGDWSGAASDAAGVPDDFEWYLPYYSDKGDPTKNRIQWASQAEPYKAHTQKFTKYEEMGPDGDPRVPYRVTEETGDAAVQCCGQVPWWPQNKYTEPGADIRMSAGPEMRLIQAEAMLLGGDWQGALTVINEVRVAAGVDPWEEEYRPTNSDEVYAALKHERGLVLWLEGRRLGDFFRWNRDNAPGQLHELEEVAGTREQGSHLLRQDLCFPIARSEVDTNENISGPTG